MGTIFALIALWSLVNLFGLAMAIFAFIEDRIGELFPLEYPITLYEETTLNVFGVVLVYLIQTIVFPVPVVITLLYWLTHVGRN